MPKFFGFICLFLLFACNKEKEVRSTALQPPLVTGFLFKDTNGNPLQQVGTPNVKTEVKINGLNYYATAYPNPVRHQVGIYVYTPNRGAKTSIWVVAARLDENLNGFNFMQANSAVVGGQPLIKATYADMPGGVLDLQKLPAGAYRIYTQIDDVLLWDDILKTN